MSVASEHTATPSTAGRQPTEHEKLALRAAIREYVALKQQVSEANKALKVLRSVSTAKLDEVAKLMDGMGQKRVELDDNIMIYQNRKVKNKPKAADMPSIIEQVLGSDAAGRLNAHVESLTNTEIKRSLTHRSRRGNAQDYEQEDEAEDGA